MLVFIDESGDPGFKLERGSSPIFVTSMVMFDDNDIANRANQKISALRKSLRIEPEFKFNKCKNEYRDRFFEEIAPFNFRTRCVVVQKDLIYSPALKTVKESFYKFFIKMMMRHDGGALQNAKVIIDGSGDRLFKRQFRSYLRKNFAPDCIKSLDLKDSVRDPLIQLADMAAGAVARSYREDRSHNDKWRKMLAANGQLENVWEFK